MARARSLNRGRDDASSVGVDVGGTFTDLVSIEASGRVEARKVLSTPSDQSEGVGTALDALGTPASQVGRIVHGTTIATNTLLERSGARVVLCATEGMSDVLELRRQERASLYDLTRHHPAPLVPQERCVGVPERLEPGLIRRPLTTAAADEVARRVDELAPDVVAVSLLHSYLDPSHERLIAQALERASPGRDVVLSSDVLPEIREYERTATTVAEAYLRPAIARYLRSLDRQLTDGGYPALAVMTSSGGMRSGVAAAEAAVTLALSGPAGGVVGAAFVVALAGFTDALTIDIGGTSADAGVILGGAPVTEAGGTVAGVPLALPRVLVETVSAGGGSIGWIDDGGALRVGPRSAGSRPGPAAFGRGGTSATVTDAHLLLGHIAVGPMSGGVTLDRGAALAAVAALATGLGATAERTARAMIASANAAMARALRRVSVERGVDPRRCVLVAFGGGGPLHGCALAEQLGMGSVLVPPFAGVLSALGLAIAPERREALGSVMRRASELSESDVRATCDNLADRTAGRGEGIGWRREWWMRARYEGQGHELDVSVAPGDDGASISSRFTAAHRTRYGYALDREVEVIGARHAAVGVAHPAILERRGASSWGDDQIDRGAPLEATVRGPSVITLPDATMLIASGWCARALPIGGWLMERDA
ncbi:MAG: hydantoinase/oxoprolinase family protein [Gemmatimonadota bacterium]|nr:hydantoinase/oxoprolinase family protein [Gemmatimonadota bacterium]